MKYSHHSAFILILAAMVMVLSVSIAATRSHKRHVEAQSQSAAHHTKRHHHSDDTSDQAASHERKHHHKIADDNAPPRHSRRHDKDIQADQSRSRHRHSSQASDNQSQNSSPKHLTRKERLHLARLHEQNLHQQKLHQQRLAKIEAKKERDKHHNKHQAQLEAEHAAKAAHLTTQKKKQHQARLAKLQALHKAHLAAIQARYNAHLARLAALHARHLANLDRKKAQHVVLSPSPSIRSWNDYAAGVPVKIIVVDLNDSRVQVSALLSSNGIGSSEPFAHMIQRAHPDVAVTGTFFSLDNLHPVGDIVINGNLAYFGGMGTALCITPNNRADMITVPWGHHHDWSGYDCVVACGPRLLQDGKVALDPHAERFKDKHMLSPNSRIGVGITKDNKLVFVMTHKEIYLGRLAKVMKDLGCQQAMNLDAGTSTGFYCAGHLMARPGRRLTNAIIVYANHKPMERTAGSSSHASALVQQPPA